MSFNNYVITIDRKIGSKGIYTGQKIAEHFGFNYVDKDILRKAADVFHIAPEKLQNIDEKASSFWRSFVQTSNYDSPNIPGYQYMPTRRQVFEVQSAIIRNSVRESSCVVVGRGGNAIFQDYEKHVGIFLHGNKEFRILNAAEYLGVGIEEAVKAVERVDRERARYHNTYAGYTWTDASNYDLCIDVSKAGVDNAVALIIDYIEDRFPELKK
ncbi:MAG: cytidylate kinase-like family protein [Clostridiales bacterium]|nr:cytidylate kinase-like family protein [Clostridiales bacterium]